MSENPRQASLESQKNTLCSGFFSVDQPDSDFGELNFRRIQNQLEGCKLIIIQTWVFFVKVMEGLIIIQKMIAGQKRDSRVLL